MPLQSDIFQMLVSLPNLAGKKREELQEELDEKLSAAFQQASDTELVREGRPAYLALLALRARRFLKRAQDFVGANASDLSVTVLDSSGDAGENLRDFHHDIYYACFFAGRYGMVSSGCFDCSRHADLSTIIVAYVKKRHPEKADVAAKTKSSLDELREVRDDADYIMNVRRLAEHADAETLRSRLKQVEAIFLGWGIP